MNLDMTPVQIIGLKTELQQIVHVLGRLGFVQIDDVSAAPDITVRPLVPDHETLQAQEKTRLLLAQVDGLLNSLGGAVEVEAPSVDGLAQVEQSVAVLLPEVQALTNRRARLQAELDSLPRYEATLLKLLPVIPPSVHLPGNMSIGIMVSRAHVGALDMIGKHVIDLTNGNADLVTRDIDSATRVMLLVFPSEYGAGVEALLGREDVSRLRLPEQFGEGPPDALITALRQRMAAIPRELKQIDDEMAALAAGWRTRLTGWRAGLRDELEVHSIAERFGETDTTFLIVGWVPTRDLETLETTLHAEIGATVLVNRLPLTHALAQRTPIAFDNPAVVKPFESLVKLQSLPLPGDFDPSTVMALFLPMFIGMMLGDIGYGALLLAITFWLRRKFEPGIVRDVLTVLMMGSAWAILFGVVFGEVFGTLGEHFGLRPLLFERTDPEFVSSLLLLTLGVGAVHITLGLILGVLVALKHRNRNHLLEYGGTLIGLVALYFVAAVMVDMLPRSLMTPAVGVMIVGIALLGASKGWLGILMGPIEFIGVIGNIMSYLRIAAIGLASVYLAKVGNDMAGLAGSLIVGAIIAVLIHALNLVLGAFSPTIHSLRLHYVEFFRKFHEGGGRPYEPFRSQLRLGHEQ